MMTGNRDMVNGMFETPVAMIVFNRPAPTEKVFAAVREAQPRELLIVADGPRPQKEGEAELCKQTRQIFERVDWNCNVRTHFAEANMGCRGRVSSGLKWVFEQVSEAIILEDDCLPNQSFFRFAQEMLGKYRNDTKVGLISGNNFLPNGYQRYPSSYYFSRFPNIWGWASWSRAFKDYDLEMKLWPELRSSGWLEDFFNNDLALVAYWRSIFDRVYRGEIDTWDYQWTYSLWTNAYLSINPAKNLVTNIGFGPGATHTHDDGPLANIPTHDLQFPLSHPPTRNVDVVSDEFVSMKVFNVPLTKGSYRAQTLYRFTPYNALNLSEQDISQHYSGILSSAMTALQAGDPVLASKLIEACIENGVKMRDLFYLKGLCCLLMNDPFGAKAFFELEISNYPDNAAAKELHATL